MRMNIVDSELGIPTAELGLCLRFYTERLFFTKVSESSTECTVALGPKQVRFRRAHRDEVGSLREFGFTLDFEVTDIHAYFARVRTGDNIEFEQELELMQPGVWQFSVRDPNGYSVSFRLKSQQG